MCPISPGVEHVVPAWGWAAWGWAFSRDRNPSAGSMARAVDVATVVAALGGPGLGQGLGEVVAPGNSTCSIRSSARAAVHRRTLLLDRIPRPRGARGSRKAAALEVVQTVPETSGTGISASSRTHNRGGRRVCHGAPATSAPVDHASRPGWGRTVRPPSRRGREAVRARLGGARVAVAQRHRYAPVPEPGASPTASAPARPPTDPSTGPRRRRHRRCRDPSP